MANYSFFIDPIDGDDGNTGLSESSAFASVIPALTLSGFVLQGDGHYAKSDTGDNTYVFSFVRGVSLIPAIQLYASTAAFPVNFRLRGANNALVLFTGKVETVDSALSLTTAIDSQFNFGVKGLRISQLTSVAANRFLFRSGPSYGMSEGVVNCAIRGFPIAASGSPQFIYVTTEGTSDAAITTGSLIGNAAVLQELGPYSWAPIPEKILLGLGAILPQPGGDYEYTPSVAQDFIAEGWANDPSYGGGTAKINTSFISIDSGASARALGPVISYPEGISFSTTHVSAVEDETKPPGSKEVIDSTELDSVRTIDVRSSEALFAQTDLTPEWVPIHKDSSHALVSGKYIQFRVTLTTEGV